MLVENAPAGRALLVLLRSHRGRRPPSACSSLAPLPRPALHALAALAGLATLCLGLMAAGLPGRLLLPAHWSELTDGLDRGLAGVQGVEWPYDGPDAWIRRTILLGAPALLAIAATLAFWPARRGAAALRIAGLVALLLLYGTAVTEHDPGAPALRGLALLLLVAAWLWLPRMPRREAGVAAAVVASVGVLSLPLAAALDGERPWWDYRAWSWFGNGEAISVRLDARVRPARLVARRRDGAEREVEPPALLEGRGARQLRRPALGALASRATTTASGPRWPTSGSIPEGRWDYNEYNLDWDERIRFTVRSLSSDMVVGAGITLDVDGIPARAAELGRHHAPA